MAFRLDLGQAKGTASRAGAQLGRRFAGERRRATLLQE
jgi:hypothetical protein